MLIQDPDNIPLVQGENLDEQHLTPKALRTVKGQTYVLDVATGLLAAGKLEEIETRLGSLSFLKNGDVQKSIERFVLACDSVEKLALAHELLGTAMESGAKEQLFRESALQGYAPPVDEYMAKYKAGVDHYHTSALFMNSKKAGGEGRLIPADVLMRMPTADAAAVLNEVIRSVSLNAAISEATVQDMARTLQAAPEQMREPASRALTALTATALTRGVIGSADAREARKLVVRSLRAIPPWERPEKPAENSDQRRLATALRVLRGEDVTTERLLLALGMTAHNSGEWAAGVKSYLGVPQRRTQATEVISQRYMVPQISPDFLRDVDFRDIMPHTIHERNAVMSNLIMAENRSIACQDAFQIAMNGLLQLPPNLVSLFPGTTFVVNHAVLLEAEKTNLKLRDMGADLMHLLNRPNVQINETDPALLSSGFLKSWDWFRHFPLIVNKLFTEEFVECRDDSGRNILHHMPESMTMLASTGDRLVSVIGKERLAQLFEEKDAAGETPLFNPAFSPDTVSRWLTDGEVRKGVERFDLLAKNAAGLRPGETNPHLVRATAMQALATQDFLKMSAIERKADWTKLYVSFVDARGRDVTSAMSSSLKLPFDKKKGRMVVEGKDKVAVLEAFSACATNYVTALITAQRLSDLEKPAEPAPVPKKKVDIER